MSTPISIVWWRKIFVKYGRGIAVLMMITLVIGFGWSQFGTGRNNPNGTAVNPDKLVLKVNGDPITQAEYATMIGRVRDVQPGPQYASARGQAVEQLVQDAVIREMAKQRNVKPDPAEIDKAVDQLKEQIGNKNASEADLDSALQQHGSSLSEYRDQLANSRALLGQALVQSYKADQQVTDTDINNQNAQIKLDVVLIPVGRAMFAAQLKGQAPLTDAQAKAKADALLAQARGGADISALARANSADFAAKQGGVTQLQPEYRDVPDMGGMDMGSLGYGKAFDEAVHKTEPGKLTEVVKASGLQQGYLFAKVLERKTDKPKDFDPRKAADALKTQRSQQKLQTDLLARFKAAKVDVLDPDLKAYYDYVKLSQTTRDMQMAQYTHAPNPPTKAEIDKQQAEVDTEFEALLKRHPDDATAALMVAEAISARKRYAPGTPAAQRDAYRDQLIGLYQTALKSVEDRNVRFQLAGLYVEKKDYPKATEQYQKIAKYLKWSGSGDVKSLQEQEQVYQQLKTSFLSINQPQEADRMSKAAADLMPKLIQAQAQEAAQQKAQQPPPFTLPPGGSKQGAATVPLKGAPSGAPAPTAPQGGTPPSSAPAPGTKR